MATPTEEVMAFFTEWSSPEIMRDSFRKRFTDETVWVNVGVATTVGIEQAIGFSDAFFEQTKAVRGEVVVDFIAESGNTVLNERTDIFYDADDKLVLSVKLMGILEMDGPKILRWRDYADLKSMGL